MWAAMNEDLFQMLSTFMEQYKVAPSATTAYPPPPPRKGSEGDESDGKQSDQCSILNA